MKKTGQTIGKYLIKRELASGSMGTVYLGYDSDLERDAAIKVIKVGMEDAEIRRRFFAEGKALSKLDHPNIIKVWGLDTDADNRPYIAMEYIEGEDLRTFIQNRSFLPFGEKLRIVIDVCMGLEHAHDNHVIHRDIKPANIRIKSNGVPKILDFGLARQASSVSIGSTSPMGTPYYMSPEQWKGRELDRRSDLFSIAAVLYELITFVKAFEANNVAAVMTRITSEPHLSLNSILPACAPELSGILDRALSKERDGRFSSCLDFANALQGFRRDLPKKQEEVLVKINLLEVEIDRCKRRSSELQSLELLNSSLFATAASTAASDDDVTGRSRIGSFDESSDYGLLLHHHTDLQHQFDNFNEKLKAAIPLLRLLRVSHRQFEDGQLEECQKTLQELLTASPLNSAGLRLMANCRKAIEERRIGEQKKARYLTVLSEARELLDRGRFQKATQSLQEILETEPLHGEALRLCDEIRRQKLLAQSQKKQRVAELLEECRRLFRAGEFNAFRIASEELLNASREDEELSKH